MQLHTAIRKNRKAIPCMADSVFEEREAKDLARKHAKMQGFSFLRLIIRLLINSTK